MKRENCDSIMRELERVYLNFVLAVVPDVKVSEPQKKALLKLVREARDFVQIRKKLSTTGNDDNYESIVERVKTKMPAGFRTELLKRIKTTPHGIGGRTSKLNFEQKRQARARIVEIIGGGKNEKDSIVEAAKEYGVSDRTMKRNWEQRVPRPHAV